MLILNVTLNTLPLKIICGLPWYFNCRSGLCSVPVWDPCCAPTRLMNNKVPGALSKYADVWRSCHFNVIIIINSTHIMDRALSLLITVKAFTSETANWGQKTISMIGWHQVAKLWDSIRWPGPSVSGYSTHAKCANNFLSECGRSLSYITNQVQTVSRKNGTS